MFSQTFSLTLFKSAIFKSDISDHFLICFMIPSSLKRTNNPKNTVIFKIVFYTELIELLKLKLYKTNWDDKVMIKLFLNRFSGLRNTYFPKNRSN